MEEEVTYDLEFEGLIYPIDYLILIYYSYQCQVELCKGKNRRRSKL